MPVREEVIERHKMEEEEYNVPEVTAGAVNRALAEGRRVIAVGTTSARTLESAFRDGRVWPGEDRTRLFIYPGYEFKAIRAMVTNFHLPKSTLLMLICAFAGRDKTLSAYREAVRQVTASTATAMRCLSPEELILKDIGKIRERYDYSFDARQMGLVIFGVAAIAALVFVLGVSVGIQWQKKKQPEAAPQAKARRRPENFKPGQCPPPRRY